MKKRSIIISIILVLLLGLISVSYGAETVPDGIYWIEDGTPYDKFVNNVHGYSLNVDDGMTVDMSYSNICAVLENQHKRIEIYKQPLEQGINRSSYINYSNKFLNNTLDHRKEYESTVTINGHSVYILQWSRDKLSRVQNDKNYYADMEITVGNYVYSIFVKADEPLWQSGGYMYLANSFTAFTPTQSAYTRKAKPTNFEDKGWNNETKIAYNQYFGSDSELKWGIFEPNAPDSFSDLDRIESEIEYEFPIILNYTSFENKIMHPWLKGRLDNAYAHNKILELTLQTPDETWGEGNMIYDVLNGEYDGFLTNYAETVSEFDHPVLFRLCNEMNGDWCPYSSYHTSKDTLLFKEFYRYIYSIFEKAGADNVIWIWNPNGVSFPNFKWNDALMYYPGDEYVDIIGLTAYNTGTYYKDEKWTEFKDLYDSMYWGYLTLFDKPMMITEFSSSSVGGDKNQWVINMFDHIQYYENIKVAVWWDGCDWDSNGNVARPYFIDEFPQLIETFKKYLNVKSDFWDIYA
ncbi:glycoside hydrolase family 26 protein [Anaerovorax odorimutans]|uniref:glycoside hydrolase family 26 protein n=1 Tax=Anaerovorax odorimutans TaxID=109327 RepID=UPI0004176749|nr:glycosyl hydrolase [Anaerovorax odorimutans]